MTMNTGGKHLHKEPIVRCQRPARNPSGNSAAGSRRDGQSPQAWLHCEFSRCKRASRRNGREKIKSTGSTVCKTAEATMLLPSQEKRTCRYRCSEGAPATMWELCCFRCENRTRCGSSRSRDSLSSCSHQSPSTASSTRQRSQTTAFSADCKAAQLMRSRLSILKHAVDGKEIFQRRLPMASLRGSGLDSILLASGAVHSACPRTCAQEHGTKLGNKITFQTPSGERFERFGSPSVPQ